MCLKRKNKNKDIDPVKEKQKLVNDSIKNSKKEKKKKKKKIYYFLKMKL